MKATIRALSIIVTGNDRENALMLAVNRRLGFTATAVVKSYAKRM
jgi:hypothetical protein